MDAEKIVFINGNDDEIAKAKALGVADDKLPKYVPGCIKNGISKEVAEEIWAQMADFAKYAFNKSHAAAYAAISMQTAYLKAHYPVEFMAGLLTSVMDSPKKYVVYAAKARRMGIEILPFDINKCQKDYSIEGNSLRPGLLSIVSLGEKAVDAIIAKRKDGYKGFVDFHERVSEVDKRATENLVKAGAFDFTGYTRKTLVDAIPSVFAKKKDHMEGQMSLFDIFETESKDNFINSPEFPKAELLENEKKASQLYFSGHPLSEYSSYIKEHIKDFAGDMTDKESDYSDKDDVTAVLFIKTVKVIYTKKDSRKMAFVSAEDETGDIEMVVFPDTYEKCRDSLVENSAVVVKGQLSIPDESEEKEPAILASEITPAKDLPCKVWVRFSGDNYSDIEDKMQAFVDSHRGTDSLILYFEAEKKIRKWDYALTKQDVRDLYDIFSPEDIKVSY